MLEMVLRGHQNTRSWISTSKVGEPVVGAHTPKILSWHEFRTFWISWHRGLIQVPWDGQGQAQKPHDTLGFPVSHSVSGSIRGQEWRGVVVGGPGERKSACEKVEGDWTMEMGYLEMNS
jgi:hypothetical protein